jgi:hypothetical protein
LVPKIFDLRKIKTLPKFLNIKNWYQEPYGICNTWYQNNTDFYHGSSAVAGSSKARHCSSMRKNLQEAIHMYVGKTLQEAHCS